MGVYEEVYDRTKPRLASLNSWPEHWFHPDDKMGWLEWYKKYNSGRRMEDDKRQIKRWIAFKARHGGKAFQENPTPRRAYALRNWAIDPAKLVKDPEALKLVMDEYKQKQYSKSMNKVSFLPNTGQESLERGSSINLTSTSQGEKILDKISSVVSLDEKFLGDQINENSANKIIDASGLSGRIPIIRVPSSQLQNAMFVGPKELEKFDKNLKDQYGRNAISNNIRDRVREHGAIIMGKDHATLPVLAHELGHASIFADKDSDDYYNQHGTSKKIKEIIGGLLTIGSPFIGGLTGGLLSSKANLGIGKSLLAGGLVGGGTAFLGRTLSNSPTLKSESAATRRAIEILNRAKLKKKNIEDSEDILNAAGDTYKNYAKKDRIASSILGAYLGLGLTPMAIGLMGANKLINKSPKRAKEEKPGLWANIRAKKRRGEKPAKAGDKDFPDKEQWNKLTKQSSDLNQLKQYVTSGGATQAPPNLFDMIGSAMSKAQSSAYTAGGKGYELYSKMKNKFNSQPNSSGVASLIKPQLKKESTETQLSTSIPGETPEELYKRIMAKNLNVDQFFQNATNHDWKIPGVPGFLARTVARKAQQNPDPYLESLRNKVPKNTIIDAIKKNPDAFKNVSSGGLNTKNIS
jgi:hypothetical protein